MRVMTSLGKDRVNILPALFVKCSIRSKSFGETEMCSTVFVSY